MRIILAAVMASIVMVFPALALGDATLKEKYESRYARTVHQHKEHPTAIPHPGRQIIDKGLSSGREPSNERIAASARRMLNWLRMLRAPAPVAAPSTAPVAAPSAEAPTPVQSSGGAGLPGCADESAGNYSTGPANTNPTTGATGRWQTLRSHYERGGICQEYDLSPGGQDACAEKIYEEQGAGAWVNC